MGMTNVVRLGGPLALAFLGGAAWVSCVNMSGSRTDALGGGDDSGTGDGTGTSSSSSGGTSSSSSGGGADVAPPPPDLCGFPETDASMPTLYSGVPTGTTCVTGIPLPRAGSWFSYHDGTGDGGLTVTAGAAMGGCGGASLCGYHARGPVPDAGGFAIYGAGIGFDLFDVMGSPSNYDARAYKGVQFWVKGTATGTRGAGFVLSPQTVHLKLVTATNRSGDDYGTYCTMVDPTVWTRCGVDFIAAKRDGFSSTPNPATDMLDLDQLQKIQVELSKFSDPADSGTTTAVTFDVWVDEVSFY
jgi:hypothetical protein